jgi:hypothetical protein
MHLFATFSPSFHTHSVEKLIASVQIGVHNEGRCFLTGDLFEELVPERSWIPDAVARNGAI